MLWAKSCIQKLVQWIMVLFCGCNYKQTSWQPNTPMHLDSLNILKTIGHIRWQCGVNWQSQHSTCRVRHQCNYGIIPHQHEMNIFFFQKTIYWTQIGLANFSSCWRCFYSLLVQCVVQAFWVCDKQEIRRHCCLNSAKSVKYSKFQCLVMS